MLPTSYTGHNVGVIEMGDGAGFGQIGLGVLRLRDQSGMRHLDGDQPVQLLVAGQIDHPETTLAQEPFRRGSDRCGPAVDRPRRLGVPAAHAEVRWSRRGDWNQPC